MVEVAALAGAGIGIGAFAHASAEGPTFVDSVQTPVLFLSQVCEKCGATQITAPGA